MRKIFSAINYLSIILLLLLLLLLLVVSSVDAKVPDTVLEQKNAVVSIYVDDKDGRHIASAGGFIVDQNGVIVTNCNVIVKWFEEVRNTLSVKIEGGTHFPIQDLISSKCENNLALIKIDAKGLPAVKLSADYKPRKGESVFVIESQSGHETTISNGHIMDVCERDRLIQISIPVKPEISGSPVLNIKGEAVGAIRFPPKRSCRTATQRAMSIIPLKGIAKQLDRYRKLEKQSAKIDKPSSLPAAGKGSLEETKTREKKEAEKNAESANAYFFRGCAYDELNMHKKAIEEYQQSVKIKPDFAEAYVNLGVAYFKLGKYPDAINAYKKAIQIKPNSISVYNKLGAAYIIHGAYSMALDIFKKLIDIDPGNAVAHFNLGIVYFLNGDKTDAFREYTILKDIDKEHANRLKDLIY